MFSTAIALYGITHHSFNPCLSQLEHTKYLTTSEAVTLTIIRSKTDQTAHGHTLHATGARKLCPV